MILSFLKKVFGATPVCADPPWWDRELSFGFGGSRFDVFVARHNCGWPPSRMTERGVELALANRWLTAVPRDNLHEIGAVTPYYWPHRVAFVVDPNDTHPLVTVRKSLFDVDLTGRPVLSISTLEHIGRGDYGVPKSERLVVAAFEKIYAESPAFLLCVPCGYNAFMDHYLTQGEGRPADVQVRFLVRSAEGNDWSEEFDGMRAARPYGFESAGKHRCWANALAVVTRGRFP